MISDSVYRVVYSNGPICFNDLVPRVRVSLPEATVGEIASSLAELVRTRRVFLNEEQTGFLAVKVKEADAQKYLERATKTSLPDNQLHLSNL